MFRLIQSIFVSFLLGIVFFCVPMQRSLAASVSATAVPETCDTEFWDVLKNRAWAEAQREITQNANIIARPDSVLSMTCFDALSSNLAGYASRNFPGNPQESSGSGGGVFTDNFIVLPDDISSSANPLATRGYVLYAALELLVLDQLMNGVTFSSPVGGCSGKYIEDNFPERMIGDRAKSSGAPSPVWSAIPAALNRSVSKADGYNCARMNEVWQRSKCYDFATESELDIHAQPKDHDGFYSLEQYKNSADYRTEASQCASPTATGVPSFSAACTAIHGSAPAVDVPTSPRPTWATAFAGATPDPDTVGGADGYKTFQDVVSGTSCAPPIKLGYVVTGNGGQKYIDSVCPTPGCWFNPPASLSGTGSCTR